MNRFPSRRAALAGIASIAIFPAVARAAGPAQRFRAIEVDVAPLRATGDTITAQWLAKDLPDLLRQSFANYLAPGDRAAPVLVARVDGVSYGSPGSAMSSAISTHDFIEGAAVVDYDGRKQTFPLSTFTDVGAPLITTPNGGELRALALAEVFASYLPRQIGL